MAVARYEVDKFDGNGDFGLWKIKIKAIFGQQKTSKAILDQEKVPQSINKEEKETMEEIAYGTIILNLSDSVLRQVIDLDTAYKVWKKLDDIYLAKDLPNKAYVREKFFTYKMDNSKSLSENLDEFKKLSSEFKNLGEKIGDENESFILLNSLPEAQRHTKMLKQL